MQISKPIVLLHCNVGIVVIITVLTKDKKKKVDSKEQLVKCEIEKMLLNIFRNCFH